MNHAALSKAIILCLCTLTSGVKADTTPTQVVVFRLDYQFQVDNQNSVNSSVQVRDNELTPIQLINSEYTCWTRPNQVYKTHTVKELVCVIRNEKGETLVQVGTVAACGVMASFDNAALIIREGNRVHRIFVACHTQALPIKK